MANFLTKGLQRVWNAFTNRDPPNEGDYVPTPYHGGYFSSSPPYHLPITKYSEESIIMPLINRIAVDCSMIDIRHIKLDKNGRYMEECNSYLNRCLTLSANTDQTNRDFIRDLVTSMLTEGVATATPIDTDRSPDVHNGYDIYSLRVGQVIDWLPHDVKIDAYDERVGRHETISMNKEAACIIENPFWEIMNEPNSILKRLVSKLALLDAIDRQSGSGKMNLIIQVPYSVKGKMAQDRADERRKAVEDQLQGSKYGIAYIDGTEHVVQLNRPLENNLMTQIEYLMDTLYSQMGFSKTILDGSADEATLTHYEKRIIEPIMVNIVTAMTRSYLTPTAYTQGQRIAMFNDPFRLIPATQLAELADKLTRNEIFSSNEMRQKLGLKPSSDPQADELRNKNLNPGDNQTFATANDTKPEEIQNE